MLFILFLPVKTNKLTGRNRVSPLDILLGCVLPMFAHDAQDIVIRLMQRAKDQGVEIPIEDGFELYKTFSSIRRLHSDALPG